MAEFYGIRLVYIKSEENNESKLINKKSEDIFDKKIYISDLENDFLLSETVVYIIISSKCKISSELWTSCSIITRDKSFDVISSAEIFTCTKKAEALKHALSLLNDFKNISFFDAIKSVGLIKNERLAYDRDVYEIILNQYKILRTFDFLHDLSSDDFHPDDNRIIDCCMLNKSKTIFSDLSNCSEKYEELFNYLTSNGFLKCADREKFKIICKNYQKSIHLGNKVIAVHNIYKNFLRHQHLNFVSDHMISSNLEAITDLLMEVEDDQDLKETLFLTLMLLVKLMLKNIKSVNTKSVSLLFQSALKMTSIDEVCRKILFNGRYKAHNALHITIAFLYHLIYDLKVHEKVFSLSSSELWGKELLTHVLLSLANDNNDEETSIFFNIIETLASDYMHDVLIAIIDKFTEYQFDLGQINNLLIILRDDTKYLEKFISYKEDDLPMPLQLHKLWISQRLDEKFPNQVLSNFNLLLDYEPLLTESLLDNTNMNIKDFNKIFKTLKEQEEMTHTEKCNVLKSLCKKDSISWLKTTNKLIIEELMKSHLRELKSHKLTQMRDFLHKIVDCGWSIESLKNILLKVKDEKNVDEILKTIRYIYEYEIQEFHCDSKGRTLKEILESKKRIVSINKLIQQIIFNTIFPKTHRKTVEELIDEISTQNKVPQSFLRQEFNKIESIQEEIKGWSKGDIETWTSEIKCSSSDCGIYKKVAVVLRGFEIFKSFKPRSVQILSLILLLNPSCGKGRLVQINTGEGKTAIVAIFAVVKALEGHKVDVITSSKELALPQVNEFRNFFNMFGFTAAHNDWSAESEAKTIYNCDIVYGESSDFQGDILRDEFSKKDIRSGRKYDVVIVDEVDNMLIDGRNSFVYLGSKMPAMNYLEHFYASIWYNLNIISQSIQEIDGKCFMVSGEPEPCFVPIKSSSREFITSSLLEQFKADLEKGSKSNLKVPNHLRELVIQCQLEEWIDNAFLARFIYKNRIHYILHENKVTIVDSNNTGQLQTNSHWSDGLHQCIQIKHGTRITPENLSTNFMSNVALFRRYGSNLFGLTGTLGDENTRGFLERIYNVDCVIVPPFMVKRFKELTPMVVKEVVDWYDEIVESNMNHLLMKRAVLIITKNIAEAEELKKKFCERFDAHKMKRNKIRLYSTNLESSAVLEAMDSGDLIIATYIAGRGTDIKTTKSVEQHGGLHVCITSLPTNARVELQNIGRTSRTGNFGTSQFIIHGDSDIVQLRNERNKCEKATILRGEKGVEKTLIKEKVFEKFCDVLNDFRDDEYTRKAVEERFGIFLKIHKDKLNENFEDFKNEVKCDHARGAVIKNPVYYIQKGNLELNKKQFQNAITFFTKAIDIEEEFSEISYYNRAYARIAGNCSKSNSRREQMNMAVNDLTKAREKIENRELELQVIQSAREKDGNILSEQVSYKITLYAVLKNAIEQAIGPNKEEHLSALREYKKQEENLIERENEFKRLRLQLNLSVNYSLKIQKLENQMSTMELQGKNSKAISQELKNIFESSDYQEYKTLKDKVEDMENSSMDLESHRNSMKAFEKSFKDKNEGSINQALSKNLDMKIELKPIKESLPDDQDAKLYEEEINELSANGCLGVFSVQEIPPINWWAALGVLVLGIAQVIGGAALCIASLGSASSFGLTLLTEGLSDVVMAIRSGFMDRTLTWAEYAVQKAINIITNIALMGLSALKKCLAIGKDVYKTAAAGFRCISKAATKVTKEGLSLFAKKIGLELGKKVGTEFATHLINLGVEKTLVPKIEQMIVEKITPKITEFLKNNELVQNWLALDAENRDHVYYNKIMMIATKLLCNSETKLVIHQIASGVADGVLNQCKYTKHVYKGIKLGKQLIELASFTDKFLQDINEEIKKEVKEINSVETKVLSRDTNQERITKTDSKKEMKEDGFFISKPEKFTSNDFSDSAENEQVQSKKAENSSADVCTKVADSVSKKMATMVNSNIFSPMTSQLVNLGVNGLTSGYDKKLAEQIQSYKEERIVQIYQNGDPHNQLYTKEYKENITMESIEGALKNVERIKNGGMIGLQDLGSVVDAYKDENIYLEVRDENNELIRTIKKTPGKKKVVIRLNGDGHVTLPNGKNPNSGGSGKNDCVFNVISSQLGETDPKKIDARRDLTATAMQSNLKVQASQHSFVESLRKNDKKRLHESGVNHVHPSNHNLLSYKVRLGERGIYIEDPYTARDLKFIKNRKDLNIEAHHIPPKSCYDSSVHSDDKTCLILIKRDHRNLASTKFGNTYVSLLKDMNSQEGGFSKTLLLESMDLCREGLNSGNTYHDGLMKTMDKYHREGRISKNDADKNKDIIKNFPTRPDEVRSYFNNKKHIFGENCKPFNFIVNNFF